MAWDILVTRSLRKLTCSLRFKAMHRVAEQAEPMIDMGRIPTVASGPEAEPPREFLLALHFCARLAHHKLPLQR